MRTAVMAVLGGMFGLYLLAAAAMILLQGRMVFPGQGGAVVPLQRLPGFGEALLHADDGVVLRAAYRRGSPGRPTIVFFHGNGDSLAGAEIATRVFAANGLGILLADYRGYGGNGGSPGEKGLYADGRAALRFLASVGIPSDRTVLVGNSLGSGVATQIAGECRVAGLIIVSGFTSLPAVAALRVRWLPVQWLMRDRFDNAAKIGTVRAPVLVLHGTADGLIPLSQARMLAAVAPRIELETVAGAGHDLAYHPVAQQVAMRWLRRTGVLTVELAVQRR